MDIHGSDGFDFKHEIYQITEIQIIDAVKISGSMQI